MRFRISISAFFIVAKILYAHDNHEAIYIVEIEAKNAIERTRIANIIHIDSVYSDRVFSIVNQQDLNALENNQKINIVSAEVLQDNDEMDDYYRPFTEVLDFPVGDEKFHTYDEMIGKLREFARLHPTLATVFSLGKSVENRDIWGLRISDDRNPNQQKKAIIYMGTHHAREHVSTEIPILFADELLNLSLVDLDIENLLQGVEVFIVPMVNPDGAIYDIASSNYRMWRKNRRNNGGSYGVDLNRNYSYGWGTGGSSRNPTSDIYMGTAPFSEPETVAIRNFIQAHPNITVALSLHTFSELILYPWGGRYEGIGGQDEVIFKRMANEMAAINHYRPMQSSDLYIASGDTCDWAYGTLGIFCFTFELSPSSMSDGGFYPGASWIEQVFNDNVEALLYLARKAPNPRAAIE